jgi:hypothetical protein
MVSRGAKCLIAGALALGLAAMASPAAAWGDLGHRVIALIAYRHLTPAARAKVNSLIADARDNPPLKAQLQALMNSPTPRLSGVFAAPEDNDFASWSVWADRYRLAHRETAPWHFIDLEVDNPDIATACPPRPTGCLLTALYSNAAVLRNPAASEFDKIVALKFIIHLVGDLHQPLHAADHHDNGGNCVRIYVRGAVNVTSLHAYWDSYLFDKGDTPDALAQRLDPPSAPVRSGIVPNAPLAARWADDWAMESNRIARDHIYAKHDYPTCGAAAEPFDFSVEDRSAARAIASAQFLKAGLRLSAVLNMLMT